MGKIPAGASVTTRTSGAVAQKTAYFLYCPFLPKSSLSASASSGACPGTWYLPMVGVWSSGQQELGRSAKRVFCVQKLAQKTSFLN